MVEKSSREEYRKVQSLGDNRTFLIGIPKAFILGLGLHKNDYVRVKLDNDRIVIERIADRLQALGEKEGRDDIRADSR